MATINYPISNVVYSPILTSSDGKANIGIQNADIEFVFAQSLPNPSVRGTTVKNGDNLRIARALTSGVILYAIYRNAVSVPGAITAVSLDTDIFGS